MKKIIFLVGVCVSCFGIAGCSMQTQQGGNATYEPKHVKIGFVGPLSGPASTYGQDNVRAVQLMIDAFNASQTGIQVDLISEDSKCTGKDAANAAQKLVNVDGVIAIFASCSTDGVTVGKIGQEKKVVIISAFALSPHISEIGNYVFRYLNGLTAGEFAANLLKKQHTKLLLVSEKTEFAQSIADIIRREIPDLVINDITYESAEKDFVLVAKDIQKYQHQIGAVFFVPQTESNALNVIKSLDKEGFFQQFTGKFIGYPLLSSNTFLSGAGDLANGLYNISYNVENKMPEQMKKFTDVYRILAFKYGVGTTIEATDLVLDGIASGNDTAEKLQVFLAGFTVDHKRDGFFGSYYFSGSDVVSVPFVYQHIESGNIVEVNQ